MSAKDKATGKEQRVEIQASSDLSETEVKRMVFDAEQHAAEDGRRREQIEVENRADNLAYAADRMFRDTGETLSADARDELESQTLEVRRALVQHDPNCLKAAMAALEQTMQRAGEAAYATAGAAADGGSELEQRV